MRRIKWNFSTPIRIAFFSELIFVAAFTVIFTLFTVVMLEEFSDQQAQSLDNEFSFFKDVYDRGGVLATVAAVERNTRANVSGQKIYVLTTEAGHVLAGNVSPSDLPSGWIEDSQTLFVVRASEDYQSRLFRLGTMRLVIGVNGIDLTEMIKTAIFTLLWSGLVVLVVSIAIGIRIANGMQRRFKHIGDVLSAISDGALDARISLDNMTDDIGVLATHINNALTRLENLVSKVQQVSADIAHDLRTPITRLRISIEDMQVRMASHSGFDQDFERIIGQTKQVQSIFDAILRVTELESGAARADFKSVDLSRLCQEIFETYQPVCQEYEHTLTFGGSTSPSVVTGDAASIFQMVANVIENAIQHCPAKSHIHLAVEGTRIAVSDNGPGIPADEFEKVFQRLYRLDRSRMTPGTGLGLNIVKAIADTHGASVRLSDQNPGLTVTIDFQPAT